MIPGCSVIVSRSSEIEYFSQCLPATIRIESLILCPERLVPAALNVTGRLCLSASANKRETSSSFIERTTIWGINR